METQTKQRADLERAALLRPGGYGPDRAKVLKFCRDRGFRDARDFVARGAVEWSAFQGFIGTLPSLRKEVTSDVA